MFYKRKNGEKSWFKNSYQEVAVYAFLMAFSIQLAINGMDKIQEGATALGWLLIAQCILFLGFYLFKFSKYYDVVD